MPLPVEACADDIATNVCCSSVWDVAERLRRVAFDAICCCLSPDCSAPDFRSYVTVSSGSPPEPLGDALVVFMQDMIPTSASRSPRGVLLGAAAHTGRFEIFLTENGWPTIETDEFGNVVAVPNTQIVNGLSKHSYGHAEKMYRAVVNSAQTKQLFPLPANPHITAVTIEGMFPVSPAYDKVGWRVPVQVTMTFPPLIEEVIGS